MKLYIKKKTGNGSTKAVPFKPIGTWIPKEISLINKLYKRRNLTNFEYTKRLKSEYLNRLNLLVYNRSRPISLSSIHHIYDLPTPSHISYSLWLPPRSRVCKIIYRRRRGVA